MKASLAPWAWRFAGMADIPMVARPLLLGSGLQSLAMSGFSAYVGIWAIQRLGSGAAALGIALFLRAGSGVVTGYFGGRLSDRVDRRIIIVASWASQTVCVACFALVGHSVVLGLALIVLFGPLGPPGRAAAAAFMADVTTPENRTLAYAAQRRVMALAKVLGPAMAAALVIGLHWNRMFFGFAGASALAVVIALATVPRVVDHTQRQGKEPARSSGMWHDHQYLVLLATMTCICMAMAATDRYLPIAAVGSYGVSASVWGFIAIVNPILVVLLQTWLTRRAERASIRTRFITSGALIGLPFLLLLPFAGVVVVGAVVLLSTVGEMLWLPLSQTLAADMAPAAQRGAYLGAYDGAVSLAFALGPMLALELNAASGNVVVWIVFAAMSMVAAVLGAAALGTRRRAAAQQVRENESHDDDGQIAENSRSSSG